MRTCYIYRPEKSTNGVVVTPLHSAWSESHVRDAGSVSNIEKGVPTAGTTSATKPEVEKYGGDRKIELATIDFLFDPLYIMGSISTPSTTLLPKLYYEAHYKRHWTCLFFAQSCTAKIEKVRQLSRRSAVVVGNTGQHFL